MGTNNIGAAHSVRAGSMTFSASVLSISAFSLSPVVKLDVLFRHCDAGKVTAPRQFELGQHVAERLLVRLILRGDFDLFSPLFSELFCCVALDAVLVSKKRLFVDCWFISDGSTGICGLFVLVFFVCCALLWAVIFAASQGAERKWLFTVGSTLSGAPMVMWEKVVGKAGTLDVGGPVAYATTICLGRGIAFMEKLATRKRNGCHARTSITL